MAYTSTNLASVQAALLALAAGTRVASVTLGDKTIDYGKSDVKALETLRSNIQSELNSSSVNCIVMTTQKGL